MEKVKLSANDALDQLFNNDSDLSGHESDFSSHDSDGEVGEDASAYRGPTSCSSTLVLLSANLVKVGYNSK